MQLSPAALKTECNWCGAVIDDPGDEPPRRREGSLRIAPDRVARRVARPALGEALAQPELDLEGLAHGLLPMTDARLGSVIAGTLNQSLRPEAFRWSAATGRQRLLENAAANVTTEMIVITPLGSAP